LEAPPVAAGRCEPPKPCFFPFFLIRSPKSSGATFMPPGFLYLWPKSVARCVGRLFGCPSTVLSDRVHSDFCPSYVFPPTFSVESGLPSRGPTTSPCRPVFLLPSPFGFPPAFWPSRGGPNFYWGSPRFPNLPPSFLVASVPASPTEWRLHASSLFRSCFDLSAGHGPSPLSNTIWGQPELLRVLFFFSPMSPSFFTSLTPFFRKPLLRR